jgi:hypothetical protein
MNSFSRLLLLVFFSALPCVTPLESNAAEQPTDQQTTLRVKEAMLEVSFIPSSKVHVTTQSGLVTLAGTVKTLAAREHAVKDIDAAGCQRDRRPGSLPHHGQRGNGESHPER